MTSQKLINFKFAYQKPENYIITLGSALVLALIMFYFTDYSSAVGNLGLWHANTNVALQIILALAFGININLLITKLKLASITKEGSTSAFGALLSILVSGCPACSITLASYLGLSSILAAFPLFGLEIKIIALAILAYSTNDLLNNLTKCDVNKEKK